MSCGSCNNCNCNPCSCDDQCDPANEPLSSALQNFITSFFGTLTKSCVNGSVVWALPCDLDGTPVPGFPRVAGEGLACYLARVQASIISSTGSDRPLQRFVYLINNASDQARMGGVANQVYLTIQSAYDAANALSVAGGFPVNILVHTASQGDYGNLSLSANYNGNVRLRGFSGSCPVGIWYTNGFDINPVICNGIYFEGIDTRDSVTGTAGDFYSYGQMFVNGDVITSSTSGDAGYIYMEAGEIGGIADASSTSGNAGGIGVFNAGLNGGIYGGADAHSTVAAGGYLILNGSVMSGNFNGTSPTQAGFFQSLLSSIGGIIDCSSPTGNSGLVIIDGHGPAGFVQGSYLLAAPLGIVGFAQLRDTNLISMAGMPIFDIIGNGSKFVNTDAITIDTNQNIINDLDVDNITFVNCVFVPDGTGLSIDATAVHTVRTFDLKDKTGFGVNVTSSEGVHTTSPNMVL